MAVEVIIFLLGVVPGLSLGKRLLGAFEDLNAKSSFFGYIKWVVDNCIVPHVQTGLHVFGILVDLIKMVSDLRSSRYFDLYNGLLILSIVRLVKIPLRVLR